jgi:hypothetical protein
MCVELKGLNLMKKCIYRAHRYANTFQNIRLIAHVIHRKNFCCSVINISSSPYLPYTLDRPVAVPALVQLYFNVLWMKWVSKMMWELNGSGSA